MANKKKEEKKPETRVKEALAAALSEDLGEIPPVSITVEELKRLEQEDRKKRRLRNTKFVSAAAIAVIVCAAGVYMVWPQTAVPVDADKNTQQKVEEGDGVVVINEGDSEGEGSVTLTETNWDKVADLRDEFPQLIIPSYVPEGYTFSQLAIEKYVDMGYKAIYSYENKEHELRIEENAYEGHGENASILTGKERKIDTVIGNAYVLNEEKGHPLVVSIFKNRKNLSIVGYINDEEYKKIIRGIDMP